MSLVVVVVHYCCWFITLFLELIGQQNAASFLTDVPTASIQDGASVRFSREIFQLFFNLFEFTRGGKRFVSSGNEVCICQISSFWPFFSLLRNRTMMSVSPRKRNLAVIRQRPKNTQKVRILSFQFTHNLGPNFVRKLYIQCRI